MEDNFSGDLHANASCSFSTINIGKVLLKMHKSKPDEILSIVCHELGHWKLKHLFKNSLGSTVYMVIFAFFVKNAVYEPSFLANFGFQEQSLFLSFVMFVWTWVQWVDMLLNIFLNFLSR